MSRVLFKLATALSLGAIAVVSSAALVQAQSRSDWLSSGDTVTYTGVLYEDEVVFAGCDDDCSDLDMNLYDAISGDLVGSDILEDANPVVVAPYEGEFTIEVVMISCYAEACETWTDSEAGF